MPHGPQVRTDDRTPQVSASLAAEPANVAAARTLLRTALMEAGAQALVDDALLVLSEVVTNAFVHAGGHIGLTGWVTTETLRIEVSDGVAHLPSRRSYAATAGTGRGLHLLDELANAWGATPQPGGKVVWFEMGTRPKPDTDSDSAMSSDGTGDLVAASELVAVTLRNVPVLMHAAWQEHAATLLREYLLYALGTDDDIFAKHAQASSAMSLLEERLPTPSLPDAAEALMAEAIEPGVTAAEVVLAVPAEAVEHFATLDALLREAITASRTGLFLSPPTQPEIDEMRAWLCTEVARQAAGQATVTPWLARTDVRATLADQAALSETYAHLAQVDTPLLATDEASVIVAASPAAVTLLGYSDAGELLGRRVIEVVPARFHQAHIAGTTFHATNGPDNLLDVAIEVPMIRADGSEVAVVIEVTTQRLDDDHQVFVARFRAARGDGA